MGSNQFQREYIEYLEKCNTELLNKIKEMKDSYENRILSNDLNKDYLISILEDVLNIFTVIPQEIDSFFDKITAAMGAFRNILLWKSEMVRLVDRISKVVKNNENFNKLLPIDDSIITKDQEFPESRMNKKGGTVRVSPMINGHIISTEPRIYLSRVPALFPSGRSETHQLSPIIEASPDASPDPSNFGCHVLKEIRIPLERININKMSSSYISEESPKTRFRGPKLWKKSLSSNKRQSDYQRKSIFSENSENVNKKMSIGESAGLTKRSENVDPLEGPSWLYDENNDVNSSIRFINYRRRKHRFATVFDTEEDYVEQNPKKSLRQASNDCYENRDEEKDDEEDLEEMKEGVSEGSEDFISTSLSSEDENYSPPAKKRPSKRRRRTEQPSDEKATTGFGADIQKRTSTSGVKNEKEKSVSNTPAYTDSSDEEEIDLKKLKQRSMKSRKSSSKQLKSLRGKTSAEMSLEKTPNGSEFAELEIRISKCSKDSNKKSTLTEKYDLENAPYVQLHDCMDEERILPERSKAIDKKKSKKSKSKSKSRSPGILLSENEGRRKRKAAPSRLLEPKLNTKLRRN